ncbi:hypothetical protein CsatB_016887 [Cannabis sativa]
MSASTLVVVGDLSFHIEIVDTINSINIGSMGHSFFIIHLFAKFSRIPEDQSNEEFGASLLDHGVDSGGVCHDNIVFIPREKLMKSDNTDAKEAINQMLSDTHLHTSVYHVTDKIVEYALRMWNDDYCNFCVRVDINVFVYVLPEHNIIDPDSDSDEGWEDVAIEFVAPSEDSIEKLEKFFNNNEIFFCTICCENVDDGEEVTQLPCKHPYHRECILKWLNTSKYCPICRYEIV